MIPQPQEDNTEDLETSLSPLELKVDALQLDKLGFTYGKVEIVYLEDLKYSKYCILTETTLYLSPAQYQILRMEYHENKFKAVKFIDKLHMRTCSDDSDIIRIAEYLVDKSKKPLPSESVSP